MLNALFIENTANCALFILHDRLHCVRMHENSVCMHVSACGYIIATLYLLHFLEKIYNVASVLCNNQNGSFFPYS